MDDATARKIQGRAKALARQWGRPELADDLAQDAIIQQLRWPGLDIEYALINLLRHEYGSSRTPGGRAKQIGIRTAIRLDAPVGEDQGENSTLGHECVGDPTPDPRTVEQVRDFSYLFRGEPRRAGKRGRAQRGAVLAQIYRLRFDEELSLKEIAGIMGMTEMGICLAVRTIRQRILVESGLEGVRDALAEDPGLTQIEIDWITL